ncbi:MAG: InlB B-repeat-containing protein, partial [Lachnoclostridium sp.]|nr:InlB B-repeat-containing protein [Lachnoclostridium sp.]
IPPVSNFVYANGKCYGIVGGILCYLERETNESDSWLEWKRISTDREGNPVTWPDDDNASYRFVYDNSEGLSVASLAKHYKEDNTLDYSLLTVYKVGSYSDETVICGAQEIELEGVNAGNYTIARQDGGGYQLAFSDGHEEKQSRNEVSDTVQLFMWKQNTERKLEAVDFSLDSSVIRRTQKSLGATVFIKNTGCQYEDIVNFKITDKDGTVLKLLDSEGNPQRQEDDGSYSYWADLYPGETESFRVTIQTNPSWESGAQELNVCVTYPVTSTSIDFTVSYDMPSIYMNGYQTTLNGKNTAFLNLKNHSMVPAENLSLVLRGNFQKNNSSTNDDVLKEIPLNIGILSDTRENVSDLGQTYCLRLNLEDIWNQYKDSNRLLYGVTVRLLTAGDDKNSVTEELYFDNPYLPALYMIHAAANDPTFGTIDGGGAYQSGETATLTAFPENGYRFVCWQDESGEEVSKDESYSIDVEDRSRELMAVFEPDGSVHSLVVNAGPNPLAETEEPGGAVHVDGCDRTVFDGKNTVYRVNDQDTVTLTAIVTGEGLCFGGWIDDSGELVSEERITNIAVTEDMELTAVFEKMPDPDFDEPVEPVVPDDPGKDDPGKDNPGGGNSTGEKAGKVKTGDSADMAVSVILILLSVVVILEIRRRKIEIR